MIQSEFTNHERKIGVLSVHAVKVRLADCYVKRTVFEMLHQKQAMLEQTGLCSLIRDLIVIMKKMYSTKFRAYMHFSTGANKTIWFLRQ